MNKYLTLFLFFICSLLSSVVYAAPGEYWEITSTMEMPGMPMAIPPQTMKVCMPKDHNLDFQKMNQDKNCKISNLKRSATKASFDIACNNDGEIMNGTAEYTLHGDTEEGTSHFTGKSHGHDMNMTQKSKGKLIGGSCDTEVEAKARDDKMKADKAFADKMMQASKANTEAACADRAKDYSWIHTSYMYFGDKPMCTGRAVQLCEALRRDVAKDLKVYDTLVSSEKQPGKQISVTQECKVDMAAATKSICKMPFNNDNYETLSRYCPAEAKSFREIQRRKDCEGRSYTGGTPAENIKKCLNGDEGDSNAPDSRKQGKTTPAEKPVEDGAANVLDSATKLIKGHFGF